MFLLYIRITVLKAGLHETAVRVLYIIVIVYDGYIIINVRMYATVYLLRLIRMTS